jgi:hypothetical protein
MFMFSVEKRWGLCLPIEIMLRSDEKWLGLSV